MKNLVFISNGMGFGGAEKMIFFIANSLSKRNFHCLIVNMNVYNDMDTDYKQKLEDGVELLTLPPVPQGKNKHSYRISQIKKVAIRHKADIIIGFTTFPNIYAKIVSTLLHVPSIISERGDPNQNQGNTLKSKISMAVVNRSKGGVFQTEGAKDCYGKALQKRGIVIPNPIFIKGEILTVPYDQREKTVVSVGRLDNLQKRYDIMIGSFRLFSAKHPEYILKLYGTGPDEKQIREWVDKAGLSDRVRFMGLTTQPMQDIASDGMFLITSDYEGISNSLLEAMAVGLPCVSTDHTPGGARLLIQDHENGLLAPMQDCEGLARAMCEFAENFKLADECGNEAKKVLIRFSPEKIIDMWEEYIISMCR